MKITLEEALSILGIEGFKTTIYPTKNKANSFREYYAKQFGSPTALIMSNEFGKDKKGKPDPKKEIWVTVLDKKDDKFDYVLQFSNKAPVEGAEGQEYGKP